jgi:hypothetical protein
MSSGSSCHFCARTNPAGSKFCNDCGEPLDLKPCSHCDAFNHVAVDRCYQCGTPFEAKQEPLAVPEPTTVGGAADSAVAAHPQAPPPRLRVEPTLDPLERIPVALSDRLEARTERVAERVSDAPPPLMPLAEEPDPDADADVDWVDPREERAARSELRVRRRARAAYAAAAALLLCAVAAAGYVAYDTGLLSPAIDWARTAGRNIVAASAAMIGEVRGARRGERADSPPWTDASSGRSGSGIAPSDSATTTSPPSGGGTTGSGGAASAAADSGTPSPAPAITAAPVEAPVPLATRTLGDPSQPSAVGTSPSPTARVERPASGNARHASRAESASKASRSARNDSPHPSARQAPPKQSRSAPAQPAADKDALATQRLIERDLAGFLPHPPAEPAPPR